MGWGLEILAQGQESLEHDLEFRFSPAPGGSGGERQVTRHLNSTSRGRFGWLSHSAVIASLFSNKTLIFAKMH